MFLTSSTKITIVPTAGKTSLLQIIPQDYKCAGWKMSHSTFRSGGITEKLPWGDTGALSRFPSYCIARLLFEADKEEDHPFVRFEGRLDDADGGEIITLYDGENIDDPVIATLSGNDTLNQEWVVGSGRKILVELSADGRENLGRLELSGQSVPVNKSADFCYWSNVEVKATSTPKDLSSVGYPGYFPVNFVCYYKIHTETKGDVVHLEILTAEMGAGCGDQLGIYSGDSPAQNKLGIVCGGNPGYATKYESRGDTMMLVFTSDEHGNYGDGWNVRYHSAPASPDPDDEDEDHTAAIVGGVLGAIILIPIIVIIYLVLTRRRTGSAAV